MKFEGKLCIIKYDTKVVPTDFTGELELFVLIRLLRCDMGA